MDYSPIITVDVEGWAQSTISPDIPITGIAEKNTHIVLDLLDELNVRSTMFVLGKFAELFPDTVKEIAKRGHEIASHGYGHVSVFRQNRADFREDLVRSKAMLEDMVGVEILGYRAPAFSIIRENLWAFEEVADAGYKYESSIYPIKHPRYGIPEFPKDPVVLELESGKSIVEVPISTYDTSKKSYPVAGGGYHRLLPSFLIQKAVKNVLTKRDFIFYCHPYEFNGTEWWSPEYKSLNLDVSMYYKLHQGFGRGYLFTSRFKNMVKKYKPTKVMADLIENPDTLQRFSITNLN